MLDHSTAWDDAMRGTITPVVQVDAWYDGQLVEDPAGDPVGQKLSVASGQVSFDSTALVQTSGQVAVTSDDDSIVPTDFDSMLACGGSVLHVQQGIQLPGGGQELMDLGWLRITQSGSQESWQPYQQSPPLVVPRGMQVSVQVEDLMAALDEDQFLAPEQPATGATVLGEIARLAQHAGLQVADTSSWTDQAIPASLTYGDSRSAAVVSLAAVLGATARMSRDGALELVASTPSLDTVDWTLVLGDASGPPLMSFARQFDRAGLYNAVKSTGTDQAGNQLVAYATEDTGPLRYGGPFGNLVYQHDSPLLTTLTACQADASTTLADLIAQRTVTIPLVVPANTALELLDVMQVPLPRGDGTNGVITLTGWARTMAVTLGQSSMQVGLAVPRAQLP